MSLMGTLAKVAIGVAVAKGVSTMTRGSTGSARSRTASGGGLEDMMGAILGGGGATSGGSAGGLGGLLDELGGKSRTSRATTTKRRTASAQPDLGGLLGQLTGASSGGAAAGGLGDLLGSLASAGAAGGLGGLLGGMLSGGGAGGLGASLNSALTNRGEPTTPPAPAQEIAAALLLKAMIQAAKSDGQIDADEQGKLMQHLGDVSPAEHAFVQQELAAPVDVEGLAAQIPEGLEAQAYTMSLMAIDLDAQAEAQYLHSFASALGLEPAEVNQIHDHFGAPKLYA